MDDEVSLRRNHFKLHQAPCSSATSLILAEILSENIGTPSVGLPPLFVVRVVELESDDALPELVHDVDPEQRLDFVSVVGVEPEQRVHAWQRAKEEPARVCATLLEARRDRPELRVPRFARLVALSERLPRHRVHERVGDAPVVASVNQLSSTVAQKLVACNMHLVALLSFICEHLLLFGSNELHVSLVCAFTGISKEDIFETFICPNVIVVGYVNS